MAPELGYSPIKKEKIVEQMNSIGYDDESAVQDAISKLLRFSLLESPNGACYREAKYINLSAKGRFYLNKILMEYSYVLFICDVVPMEDQFKVDLLQKFGNDEVPLPGGQLSIKHESVKKFVSFLKLEEDDQECGCPKSHQSFLKNKKGGKRTSEAIEFSTESVISKMKTPITKAVPKLISVKPIKKSKLVPQLFPPSLSSNSKSMQAITSYRFGIDRFRISLILLCKPWIIYKKIIMKTLVPPFSSYLITPSRALWWHPNAQAPTLDALSPVRHDPPVLEAEDPLHQFHHFPPALASAIYLRPVQSYARSGYKPG